jgi:hypothetical protein
MLYLRLPLPLPGAVEPAWLLFRTMPFEASFWVLGCRPDRRPPRLLYPEPASLGPAPDFDPLTRLKDLNFL